jgi:acyl CoA:acetate/3-ketoacid CoA transferase beta subunit
LDFSVGNQMKPTGEQIILTRVLEEVVGVSSVGLGPGLPEAATQHLANGTRRVALRDNPGPTEVDVAVVEALEVSERGDLAVADGSWIDGVQARRWIVVGRLERRKGEPVVVKNCRFPVQRRECVDLVITDLGVIRVGKVGFELRELAPGVSSDDVRLRMRTSLHVADDLHLVSGLTVPDS